MAKPSIVLDVRRAKANGDYPIKIRVSHKKVRKYYSTGYDCKDQDALNKMFDLNVRGKSKVIKETLNKLIEKADGIIKEMPQFNFSQFEESFLKKSSTVNYTDVFEVMEDYKATLSKENRIGYASSINDSISSFKKFLDRDKRKHNLAFGDITTEWLNVYELWMSDNQKSYSTTCVYLKNLRTCYNIAIENGLPQEWYPFGKRKFVIPSTANHKRALTFNQVNQLFRFNCIGDSMEYARDIWIFSYLCNGINFKDIASFKWHNLDGDKLTYIREKTKRTKKDRQESSVIHLLPQALDIVKRWGTDSKDADNYIFPIFTKGQSEEEKHKTKVQANKVNNSWTKKIGKELEFDFDLTFQYARHTYATVSLNLGVSMEYISQALDHSDFATTKNYLGSFEDEKIREHSSKLLNTGSDSMKISHKAG